MYPRNYINLTLHENDAVPYYTIVLSGLDTQNYMAEFSSLN